MVMQNCPHECLGGGWDIRTCRPLGATARITWSHPPKTTLNTSRKTIVGVTGHGKVVRVQRTVPVRLSTAGEEKMGLAVATVHKSRGSAGSARESPNRRPP